MKENVREKSYYNTSYEGNLHETPDMEGLVDGMHNIFEDPNELLNEART